MLDPHTVRKAWNGMKNIITMVNVVTNVNMRYFNADALIDVTIILYPVTLIGYMFLTNEK